MKASKRGAEYNPVLDEHGVLAALAAVLAPMVAEILATKMRSPERLTHTESPLGKRRTLRLIRSGVLPAVKVGRTYYIKREDIETFLMSTRARPGRPQVDQCTDKVLSELRAAGWS